MDVLDPLTLAIMAEQTPTVAVRWVLGIDQLTGEPVWAATHYCARCAVVVRPAIARVWGVSPQPARRCGVCLGDLTCGR